MNELIENISKQAFLQKTFWGNPVFDYFYTIAIIVAGISIIKIIEKIVIFRLKEIASETETTFDDFLIENIHKTIVPIANFGVIYIGLNHLALHLNFLRVINAIAAITIAIFSINFILALIIHIVENVLLKGEDSVTQKKSLKGLITIVRFVVWAIGIVFVLDNLGFKISAVVAGLGIGGMAVALAAQTVLKDLFSYVAILFDKPFEPGDFIIVDDKMGNVDKIGIKTTRLISLGGEQLIFSNTDLTDSRIQNYKRMQRRRVLFKIGVTYQTKKEQLEKIPTIIKDIISNTENVEFDRSHFSSFGASSLDFETVYYVVNREYLDYMNAQQEMNLKIFEEFSKEGIEFAYPTQTLFIEK